jgi:hypothetical protein
MLGYQPVDADHLGLGMAKSILRGVADDRRKLQVIFFTQQLSDNSQFRASGSKHSLPPRQSQIKNPSRRGAALFMRGEEPHCFLSS